MPRSRFLHVTLNAILAISLLSCRPEPSSLASASEGNGSDEGRPDILLVTLDTTRADAMDWESGGTATPNLAALAERGVRFAHAYTTVPTTLPAHTSLLSGQYPAEHGVHENARTLDPATPLVTAELSASGYETAAFVSAAPLAARFGLARGFALYDDDFPTGQAERSATQTTKRAEHFLTAADSTEPIFLWVHYFDPHDPYQPPEPFASRFRDRPYLGEVAAMDDAFGSLLATFEQVAKRRGRSHQVLVVGDHGEGLGDHGEVRHGNLLYQGTIRVPLVIAGEGVTVSVRKDEVSTRRVYDTIRAWAKLERIATENSLLDPGVDEVVIAEAMKPFLQYGWQPQVAAVGPTSAGATSKAIMAGDFELFDLTRDPHESLDLSKAGARLPTTLADAISSYPVVPRLRQSSLANTNKPALDNTERAELAALGYADATGPSVRVGLREDAPAPRAMTGLFELLDRGSLLFAAGRYQEASVVFEKVRSSDPNNPAAVMRLAIAASSLGETRKADRLFEEARRLAPDSPDVRHYHAMHLLRSNRPLLAEPFFMAVLDQMPNRLPALEALSRIRERQGRLPEARELLERANALGLADKTTLVRLGGLRMMMGDSRPAIDALERARALPGPFPSDLELGVLYLAERQFEQARQALDRVPPNHPGWPMAAFKRAQVSVLLDEPDQAEYIERARQVADDTTRKLIAGERLFQ